MLPTTMQPTVPEPAPKERPDHLQRIQAGAGQRQGSPAAGRAAGAPLPDRLHPQLREHPAAGAAGEASPAQGRPERGGGRVARQAGPALKAGKRGGRPGPQLDRAPPQVYKPCNDV